MRPAIVATGLCRDFGNVRAVRGLTLEAGRGEIFMLVGPDGAGKTTAIRMLAGILAPTSGEAEVAGCDVRRNPEAVKRRIGYLSQRFGLYPDLTVDENLRFYADVYGVPRGELRGRIESLLGFSMLAPFRGRHAGKLSGGMKQKLGLACALVHRPEVLLLDEPTNGVDPVSRREFWRILSRLGGEGVTVFMSTSYLDEAERCGRLGLMHAGRLLECGAPSDLKARLGHAILEVGAEDVRGALSAIRAAMPGSGASMFGSGIHVASPDPDRDEAGIRAALAGAGIGIREVRRVSPSMEDVFLTAAFGSKETAAGGGP